MGLCGGSLRHDWSGGDNSCHSGEVVGRERRVWGRRSSTPELVSKDEDWRVTGGDRISFSAVSMGEEGER
ncbi:unnamed protein product, partial [Linum tenue]